ncbi:MAG TPA: LuxR C-terminal-related transcriptional regulator, partial [Solirubrobacteraceae bacterium]|nr:LuxR C-terminal-related transcriptional regulator [Solirubrobacteraceae bacterium]
NDDARERPARAGDEVSFTERERAVLRLLGTFLTIEEIGTELYVSRNTVKTHVRAIYQKLGVGERREAVRRARELAQI